MIAQIISMVLGGVATATLIFIAIQLRGMLQQDKEEAAIEKEKVAREKPDYSQASLKPGSIMHYCLKVLIDEKEPFSAAGVHNILQHQMKVHWIKLKQVQGALYNLCARGYATSVRDGAVSAYDITEGGVKALIRTNERARKLNAKQTEMPILQGVHAKLH